jgi:hypothetical protein
MAKMLNVDRRRRWFISADWVTISSTIILAWSVSSTTLLPADVDYISSGTPNNLGLNLQPLQNLYSTTLNAMAPTMTRLASAFLPRVLKMKCLHPCRPC